MPGYCSDQGNGPLDTLRSLSIFRAFYGILLHMIDNAIFVREYAPKHPLRGMVAIRNPQVKRKIPQYKKYLSLCDKLSQPWAIISP
jgi:hypothetical protein